MRQISSIPVSEALYDKFSCVNMKRNRNRWQRMRSNHRSLACHIISAYILQPPHWQLSWRADPGHNSSPLNSYTSATSSTHNDHINAQNTEIGALSLYYDLPSSLHSFPYSKTLSNVNMDWCHVVFCFQGTAIQMAKSDSYWPSV